MTLLFTGASGFLGSNIIQLLNGAYNIISIGLSPQDTYLVDIATDIPTFTDAFDVVFTLQVKRIPCLRRKQRSDFF